jgi:hypothetical protein
MLMNADKCSPRSKMPDEQNKKATKRGLWAAVETAPATLVASSRLTKSIVTPIMSRVHMKDDLGDAATGDYDDRGTMARSAVNICKMEDGLSSKEAQEMLWIRWAFIVFNVAYSVMSVIWSRQTSLSEFGKLASASIWVWQLVGVGLVIWYDLSAWHLLWWFMVGYVLMLAVVKIMSRFDYYTN